MQCGIMMSRSAGPVGWSTARQWFCLKTMRGGVDPKTVRRERPPDCADIRKEMQEVAGKRRRFGYRRIGVLLERKGMIMNHKKLYRIYREEGLSVRRRRGRKRARGTRTPMPVAAHPNARWSLDFVSDSFGASRKFRILAVIDEYPGMLVPRGGHQPVRRTGRPRARRPDPDLRQARLHCQ
ncbi:HTH-like domain protein [Antarctobacter heliothermus]|uniref:HTH-like domain protein n=1 Tax=Antarctobacter heliothermus TaxID=74033 RepID=A0A222E2F8_9RHOB|nr:HTH-like domain protein [Antarctobacter heliothermus]